MQMDKKLYSLEKHSFKGMGMARGEARKWKKVYRSTTT